MPRRPLLVIVALLAALAVAWLVAGGDDPGERGPAGVFPGAGVSDATLDPIAYDDGRREELEARAAAGLSHVLYAKSPGGADRLGAAHGRAAARSSTRPPSATASTPTRSRRSSCSRAPGGRTRAPPTTSTAPSGSRRSSPRRAATCSACASTCGPASASRAASRAGRRVRGARGARGGVVDERFDPAKALDATARYLVFARERLGRDDLAVAAYHMGVGNLQGVLAAYGEADIPYAQLFFDSLAAAPRRGLAAPGRAGRRLLDVPVARRRGARDHAPATATTPASWRAARPCTPRKNSAEEVLHPPDGRRALRRPVRASGRARAAGELRRAARRASCAPTACASTRGWASWPAPATSRRACTARCARRRSRAARRIGAGTRAIGAARGRSTVTSTVRDERYQRVLVAPQRARRRAASRCTRPAGRSTSRATTRSRAQALAFQFMLDRLHRAEPDRLGARAGRDPRHRGAPTRQQLLARRCTARAARGPRRRRRPA